MDVLADGRNRDCARAHASLRGQQGVAEATSLLELGSWKRALSSLRRIRLCLSHRSIAHQHRHALIIPQDLDSYIFPPPNLLLFALLAFLYPFPPSTLPPTHEPLTASPRRRQHPLEVLAYPAHSRSLPPQLLLRIPPSPNQAFPRPSQRCGGSSSGSSATSLVGSALLPSSLALPGVSLRL